MNIGCQTTGGNVSCVATARFDREAAAKNSSDWLDRAAARFRLAMTLQIPVGYEDEEGFHCGMHHAEEKPSQSLNRKLNCQWQKNFDPGA